MRSSIALLFLLFSCTTPRLLPSDASTDGMDARAGDPADARIDAPPDTGAIDAYVCLPATERCLGAATPCCDGYVCALNTLGTVCCGIPLQPCTRIEESEDCCGDLLCRTTRDSGGATVCCVGTGFACASSAECCETRQCIDGQCRVP